MKVRQNYPSHPLKTNKQTKKQTNHRGRGIQSNKLKQAFDNTWYLVILEFKIQINILVSLFYDKPIRMPRSDSNVACVV